MTDTHFIAGLASFTRFADVADPAHFVPAPDAWRIYCCDIVKVGIPFTHVDASDSVGRWKTRDIPWPGLPRCLSDG